MNLVKFTLLNFSYLLFISSISYSSTTKDYFNFSEKVILEISDKHNEAKLGLTSKHIYLIFNDEIKDYANKLIRKNYDLSLQDFDDSDGNFILGKATQLSTNKIEINLKDVFNLTLQSGKLYIDYRNKPLISFDDVMNYKGINVLNNFHVEDLELFIQTYKKLA